MTNDPISIPAMYNALKKERKKNLSQVNRKWDTNEVLTILDRKYVYFELKRPPMLLKYYDCNLRL